MNGKNLLLAAGVWTLALATLAVPMWAQGPLYDKVIVDLPYAVTIGNKVLQPGNYVIRQNDSMGGGSRVLLIYSNGGRSFETSTMTIPALDQRTPESTKVVLHRFGNDYFFDKIWIQGKNYGYEFPLPESVKSRQRERMQPVSVAARYESTTQQAQQTQQTEKEAERPTEVAQAAPPPAPPAAEPAPAPAPAPPEAAREMPHTSAGWLTMLLGGGFLATAGLGLRRRA